MIDCSADLWDARGHHLQQRVRKLYRQRFEARDCDACLEHTQQEVKAHGMDMKDPRCPLSQTNNISGGHEV